MINFLFKENWHFFTDEIIKEQSNRKEIGVLTQKDGCVSSNRDACILDVWNMIVVTLVLNISN